jgi:phosphoglycerol transferase MdoB-like AlkP superfamily enzyme
MHVRGAVEEVYYDVSDSAFSHNTVFDFTPIGYHLANIVDVFEKTVDQTDEDGMESAEERHHRELIEAYYNQFSPLPDNGYAGVFKDKNVILIQVESLENMVIGQTIGGVEITPNLNKLVSSGGSSLYFPNIYDQTKAGNSSDCDLMINTSLLPTGDVFFRSYSDKKLPSLPVILRNEQYGTYYYNGSGPSSVWPYTEVYQNVFGYNTDKNDPNCNFHMIEALSPEDKIYRYSSDENTFRYALEDLLEKQEQHENFFSQIILCSSHTPFRYDNISAEENRNLIPAEYWLPIPEEEELAESKTFHYLNALHYVDAQIGIFLENAREEGLLEETVVLIYGDHLGLHKYAPNEAERIAEEYPDYAFVNDAYYNSVPLIIYDPSGKTAHQTFPIPGGQSDVMPTLLYLLGVDQGEYVFAMGKVLVNTDRVYTVTSNGTLIGEIPDETTERILKLSYKISDYLVTEEYLDVSEHARSMPHPASFSHPHRKPSKNDE